MCHADPRRLGTRSDIPSDKGGSTLKWAAMPFVAGPKANLGTGAAQTLSIPSIAKNKEAAAEFLTWWGKPANVAKISAASGQVPPNTAAVASLKTSVGATDYWNLALAESPDLQGEPFCPGWLPMLGTVSGSSHVRLLPWQEHLCRVCFKGELRRYAEQYSSPPGPSELAGVITAEQTPSATRPRCRSRRRSGRVSATALIMLVPVLVVALVLRGLPDRQRDLGWLHQRAGWWRLRDRENPGRRPRELQEHTGRPGLS